MYALAADRTARCGSWPSTEEAAMKIRCEAKRGWIEKVNHVRYARSARCQSEATTTFVTDPRYFPAESTRRYCDEHAEAARLASGWLES